MPSKIKRSDLSAVSQSELDSIDSQLSTAKCFSDKFRELFLAEELRVNRSPEYLEALKALANQSDACDFAPDDSQYSIDEIADHIKDKMNKYKQEKQCTSNNK